MLTVHASGGPEMLKAAKRAAVEAASSQGRPSPLVVAVTVLTSLSERMLPDLGITRPLAHHVEELAALADMTGLDGVVASPHELPLLRPRFPRLKIVTPGIRATSAAGDDQSRTLSAADALAAGADYLVVGRPIIAAADPRQAATELARTIAG
jgi:orotidine-5'-phosphate decarboxylase